MARRPSCLATSSATPVDLLLTDLMMPLMTGDEVAIRVRELWPDVRVVLMSGYAMPAMLANGDGSGLDHPLLDKPFTRSTLLAKVREVLDGAPPPGGEHLSGAQASSPVSAPRRRSASRGAAGPSPVTVRREHGP